LVDRCKKLEILVSEKHLTSLQKIDISGCSSLREFSLSWDSIEELDLSHTCIEILHSSIGRLSKLRRLDLQGLRLKDLPKEISCLRSLTKLLLSNCNIVTKSKLEAIFDGLESLRRLYLQDCGNLLELPENIDSLSSLYELRLGGSNLKMLPTSIKNVSSLEIMSLDNCKKLGWLPELPPHIKMLSADNCTSLVCVMSLKALLKSMKGVQRYISFKNSMKLDAPSLDRIMEDATLAMKSVAFHNTIAVYDYGYSYSTARVCLPGCRVPRQFKFRTICSSSSITIEPPHLSKTFRLIFSAVVSSSYGMKERDNDAIIKCQSYSEDGRRKLVGNMLIRNHEITDLSMDHVFVWISPFCRIFDKSKVFEFSVTTTTGEHNGFYSLKECGICPIYYSEFPRIAAAMNLDRDLEREIALKLSQMFGSDLNESMQFESESIERD
ncbi:disease resistance protein, partial [Trifolium medium]|nr:disease resistance protein [Trifolium medium]